MTDTAALFGVCIFTQVVQAVGFTLSKSRDRVEAHILLLFKDDSSITDKQNYVGAKFCMLVWIDDLLSSPCPLHVFLLYMLLQESSGDF